MNEAWSPIHRDAGHVGQVVAGAAGDDFPRGYLLHRQVENPLQAGVYLLVFLFQHHGEHKKVEGPGVLPAPAAQQVGVRKHALHVVAVVHHGNAVHLVLHHDAQRFANLGTQSNTDYRGGHNIAYEHAGRLLPRGQVLSGSSARWLPVPLPQATDFPYTQGRMETAGGRFCTT
jgi:hypothetical protein